jgi:hypothetical protein
MLPLRIFYTQYVTYLQLKIEYSGHYHSEALFENKHTTCKSISSLLGW